MIEKILVYLGMSHEAARIVETAFWVAIVGLILLAEFFGARVFVDVDWDSIRLSLLSALIVFAVTQHLDLFSQQKNAQEHLLDSLRSFTEAHSHDVTLMNYRQYVRVAQLFLRGYKGDLAFFNVTLKMLEKQDLYEDFWRNGILRNTMIGEVVLCPSPDLVDPCKIVKRAAGRSKPLEKHLEKGKVRLTRFQDDHDPRVGGLLFSRPGAGGDRVVDHAVFLIRSPLFAVDECVYQGSFLFCSAQVGSRDPNAFFSRLGKLARDLHATPQLETEAVQ